MLPSSVDSYWVEDGVLLAGEYPGDLDPEVARAKLGELLDCGIRAFIDLTETSDPLEPYEVILMEEAEARGIEVSYARHPIRDINIPTVDGMRTILRALADAHESGAPAYVHCWGGIGRTGTVVGCWLKEQGALDCDPVEAIARLRKATKKRDIKSPEASSQVRFIARWK